MKTTFNYDGQYLYMPTVFRPDFNNFAPLNATQAWSLFFTASNSDIALGTGYTIGRLWTTLLVAAVTSSVLNFLVFQSR